MYTNGFKKSMYFFSCLLYMTSLLASGLHVPSRINNYVPSVDAPLVHSGRKGKIIKISCLISFKFSWFWGTSNMQHVYCFVVISSSKNFPNWSGPSKQNFEPSRVQAHFNIHVETKTTIYMWINSFFQNKFW